MAVRKLPTAALLAWSVGLIAGCGYVEELNLPVVTEQGKQIDRGESGPKPRTYPAEVPLGEPYDIEVIRKGNAIILDNRTVRSYEDIQLWLNQQWGATLDKVPVGRSEPIALRSFVNHHGERYPVARFLAPDAGEALVLAELKHKGRMHKLTVRLRAGWRKPSSR